MVQDLAPIRRVLCAAPSYLATHGTPAHPEELGEHDCLQYGHLATHSQWQLTDKNGKPFTVKLHCRGYSNNGEVLREAAIAGAGIALQPTFIVGNAIKAGDLVVVLPDYCPPPITAYLGYAPNRHLSTKIQLLTAFLQDWFKHPAWDMKEA